MKRISLIFIACLVLIIAFAPRLLSTPFGLKILEAFFPSNATIGSASLSWRGPQRFEHITLSDDSITATIPSLSIDQSFIALLFSPYSNIKCHGAEASIDGKPFFTDISLSLESPQAFSASGKTPEGDFSIAMRDRKLQLTTVAFPVAAADGLLSLVTAKYHGLLPLFFGETLSASMRAHIDPENISGNATITSSGIRTSFEFATEDSRVHLLKPAPFTWTITDPSLQSTIPLVGTISSLHIPYEGGNINFPALQGSLIAKVSHVSLTAPLPVAVEEATLKADFSQNLTIALDARFPQEGSLTLSAILNNWMEGPIEGTLTASGKNTHIMQAELTLSGKSLSRLNVRGHATLDIGGDAVAVESISGKVDVEDPTLHLTAHIGKGSIDFTAGPAKITLTLDKVETPIIEAWTKLPLTPMVGPHISFETEVSNERFSLSVNSQLLSLKGNFTKGKALTLSKPLSFKWSATPEGYAALSALLGQEALTLPLAEPAHIALELTSLSLPLADQTTLFPSIDSNLYTSKYTGTLSSKRVAFSGASMTDLSLQVEKKEDAGPLAFNMSAAIAPGRGVVEIQGRLENLYAPSGDVSFLDSTTTLSITLSQVPTSLLDGIAQLSLPERALPSRIFGEKTNARIEMTTQNMTGPLTRISHTHGKEGRSPFDQIFDIEKSQYPQDIGDERGRKDDRTDADDLSRECEKCGLSIELDATHCRATLHAALQNGFLTLERPLTATCTITPELTHLLTGDADLEIISANSPMRLHIDNENVSIPLKNLKESTIPFFRLDVGQVTMRNKGATKQLADFLRLEKPPSINVWFAPCEGRLSKGALSIDRTEILVARRYQLALWGGVNFAKQYVDMVFGITAPAMQAALGITPPSSSYVLKIPIRGRFGKVRLDPTAAKQKVALMIAKQAGGALVPQGSIWGGVLDAVGSITDDQGDVPQPKRPFPWEQQSSYKAFEFNKKRIEKKRKSNFKELKKLLTQS